jgi:thymidylate kinase
LNYDYRERLLSQLVDSQTLVSLKRQLKTPQNKKMLTVALVGGDGAGKTTIAKNLAKSLPFSVKYLYMGPSILSSDLALPTSRLARWVKIRSLQKADQIYLKTPRESISSHDFHYKPTARSSIWLAARLLNRLAEASYRQFLSLIYRLRGNVVIYDRHFLFDAIPDKRNSQGGKQELFEHLEYVFLYYCFPKPNLVIFLDAPADVLYDRKKESSIDHLDKRRKAVLKQGEKMANFVRVDATQPLEKVVEEVTEYITKIRLRSKRRN